MSMRLLFPAGWAPPSGYANGIEAPESRAEFAQRGKRRRLAGKEARTAAAVPIVPDVFCQVVCSTTRTHAWVRSMRRGHQPVATAPADVRSSTASQDHRPK